MAIVDLNSVSNSKFLPILQGIAGGTLLYVTLCEVLPREKARWHQNTTNRAAGLSQFLGNSFKFPFINLMRTLMSLFIDSVLYWIHRYDSDDFVH